MSNPNVSVQGGYRGTNPGNKAGALRRVAVDNEGRLLLGGASLYYEFVDGSGAAYAAGDMVGAVVTLDNMSSGLGAEDTVVPAVIADSFVVTDDAGASPELLFLFFYSVAPGGSDNNAFTWGAADAAKSVCVGSLRVTAADWNVPIAAKPGVAAFSQTIYMRTSAPDPALPGPIYVACIAMGAATLGNGKKVRIYMGVRK